jgi:catechol 2,3-dioxygenase-like lactoylglutathione lyase family enzyme
MRENKMRLLHVGLVNRSQKNADRFFKDILGLKKGDKKHLSADLSNRIFGFDTASDLIYYQNESIVFEVFIIDRKDTVDNQIGHICLEVAGRDHLAQRCRQAGLVVEKIDKESSMLMFIRDFDGNLYEIKEAIK